MIIALTGLPHCYLFILQYWQRSNEEQFKAEKYDNKYLLFVNFEFYNRYENYYYSRISKILYVTRGMAIFIWQMFCPLFRMQLKLFFKSICCVFGCCGHKRGISMDFEKQKKVDEIVDIYKNSSNSFLYSSLNMEIVCSILKGINVILRDVKHKGLSGSNPLLKASYREVKSCNLKQIEVLNREKFEKVKAKEIKAY